MPLFGLGQAALLTISVGYRLQLFGFLMAILLNIMSLTVNSSPHPALALLTPMASGSLKPIPALTAQMVFTLNSPTTAPPPLPQSAKTIAVTATTGHPITSLSRLVQPMTA